MGIKCRLSLSVFFLWSRPSRGLRNKASWHLREMHCWGPNLFWHECYESQILGPQVIDYRRFCHLRCPSAISVAESFWLQQRNIIGFHWITADTKTCPGVSYTADLMGIESGTFFSQDLFNNSVSKILMYDLNLVCIHGIKILFTNPSLTIFW